MNHKNVYTLLLLVGMCIPTSLFPGGGWSDDSSSDDEDYRYHKHVTTSQTQASEQQSHTPQPQKFLPYQLNQKHKNRKTELKYISAPCNDLNRVGNQDGTIHGGHDAESATNPLPTLIANSLQLAQEISQAHASTSDTGNLLKAHRKADKHFARALKHYYNQIHADRAQVKQFFSDMHTHIPVHTDMGAMRISLRKFLISQGFIQSADVLQQIKTHHQKNKNDRRDKKRFSIAWHESASQYHHVRSEQDAETSPHELVTGGEQRDEYVARLNATDQQRAFFEATFHRLQTCYDQTTCHHSEVAREHASHIAHQIGDAAKYIQECNREENKILKRMHVQALRTQSFSHTLADTKPSSASPLQIASLTPSEVTSFEQRLREIGIQLAELTAQEETSFNQYIQLARSEDTANMQEVRRLCRAHVKLREEIDLLEQEQYTLYKTLNFESAQYFADCAHSDTAENDLVWEEHESNTMRHMVNSASNTTDTPLPPLSSIIENAQHTRYTPAYLTTKRSDKKKQRRRELHAYAAQEAATCTKKSTIERLTRQAQELQNITDTIHESGPCIQMQGLIQEFATLPEPHKYADATLALAQQMPDLDLETSAALQALATLTSSTSKYYAESAHNLSQDYQIEHTGSAALLDHQNTTTTHYTLKYYDKHPELATATSFQKPQKRGQTRQVNAHEENIVHKKPKQQKNFGKSNQQLDFVTSNKDSKKENQKKQKNATRQSFDVVRDVVLPVTLVATHAHDARQLAAAKQVFGICDTKH